MCTVKWVLTTFSCQDYSRNYPMHNSRAKPVYLWEHSMQVPPLLISISPEYQQCPSTGGVPTREWVLTDLADSSQLGTSQRVREKMVKMSQASHTSTATPVAATGGERMEEKDRRIQEAEMRAQAAEERAREAERAKDIAETRRQEAETRRQEKQRSNRKLRPDNRKQRGVVQNRSVNTGFD